MLDHLQQVQQLSESHQFVIEMLKVISGLVTTLALWRSNPHSQASSKAADFPNKSEG